MAVEASHLSLLPPQYIHNTEMTKSNGFEAFTNIPSSHIGYGLPPTTSDDTLLPPMYASHFITDSVPVHSGITYTIPPVSSRKHHRDLINNIPLHFFSNAQNSMDNNKSSGASFTFLGQDISSHIQQQHQLLDIDHFISHHTEKVRMEIDKRRKRESSRIIEAMEEGMRKRLREKDEEIEQIGKLNWALEEKVKSLCVENQIWRELAHSNEATVHALRTNLDQVLTQVHHDHYLPNRHNMDLVDDAQSCCGSNSGGGDSTNECNGPIVTSSSTNGNNNSSNSNNLCKKCGKEESCVLLLPCRHLCLCTLCVSLSILHICPVCKFPNNASLHVKTSF